MLRTIALCLLACASLLATDYTSTKAGNWSDSTLWSPAGVPGSGDRVTINHAVVQDIPNLVIGVNGAAPLTSYLDTLAGGGGTGYTSCSASLSGGTAARGGQVSCAIVGGAVVASITDRGSYTACPTVTITATGGSGATLPGTLTCSAAGGIPAITVGGLDTAILTVAADTYVRGTMLLAPDYLVIGNALIVSPGGNLFMDMTHSAGAIYRIEDGSGTRKVSADCSSLHGLTDGRGCSIQGYGGATSFESTGGRYMSFSLNNVYFKHVGDSHMLSLVGTAYNNSGFVWSIDVSNNTFDTSGMALLLPDSNSTVKWVGNIHRNTQTGANNLFVNILNGPAVDWEIVNNSFDSSVAGLFSSFTITGNAFVGGLSPVPNNYPWTLFRDNFWRYTSPDGVIERSGLYTYSASNMYFFADSYGVGNPHYFSEGTMPGAVIDNFIGQASGRIGIPAHHIDSGEWFGSGFTLQNSIITCNQYGNGPAEITAIANGGAGASTYLHNTWCGGYQQFGMIDTNETGGTTAGILTMKSNLMFDTATGDHTSLKIRTISIPGTQDVCTTTSASSSNCDYNASYQLEALQADCTGCTNQGRGYGGLWSFTPGYHDLDGQNPSFVDITRKVENFDQKYLGKSLSPQWAIGTSYSYGDMVKNSDAQVYAGEVFNFRCINPSGCSGAPGPGSYDTLWRNTWEFSSLYWIRELTATSATYTDATIGCTGCTVIQALINWVRKGYSPTNAAYNGAAHDGGTIGAVPYTAPSGAPPTITSDTVPPVVSQGTTHNFSANCTGTCVWSLASGSVGSINSSTGVYTAPTAVTVNTSIAGCQVLPPDHGNNLRVDTLPVRSESAAWVALLTNKGRWLNLVSELPWNPMSSTTPTHGLTFLYTSANDSPPGPPFQVVPLNGLKLQSGYYQTNGADHHYIGVRPDTCRMTELYAFHGSPFPYSGSASSGTSYDAMTTGTAVQWGGATDAAGLFLLPNTLRVTEVMKAIADGSNVVKHPIRITLNNYSQLGSYTPEWPATAVASITTGRIPYGGRFRLKSSGCTAIAGFIDANCAYLGSNPATLVILNTLKRYGIIAADGGDSLDTSMDTDAAPPSLRDAVLTEIPTVGGIALVGNLEAVDGTLVAPTDTAGVTGGLIDINKAMSLSGFTHPQFANVIITNEAGSASIRVALKGATLDLERSQYAVQAGASAFAIPYHTAGISSSVAWSMSPSVGSLDASTGVYTPPSTASTPTVTTVTVTSNADSTIKAQTRIVILPNGPLGLLVAAPGDYTDTHGQKWWAVGMGTNYPVISPGLSYPASLYYDPTTTPATDSYIYAYSYHPRYDTGFDLRVPNGVYGITIKMASRSDHYGLMNLETQGVLHHTSMDPYDLAGGTAGVPVDLTMQATVTDGLLSVWARMRDGYGGIEAMTIVPGVLVTYLGPVGHANNALSFSIP